MRFAIALALSTLAACSSSAYSEAIAPDAGAAPHTEAGSPDPDGGASATPDASSDAIAEAPADAPNLDDGPCLGKADCTRVIFVTSTISPGSLGGLPAADDRCQMLAGVVTALQGRQFRAWLSTSSSPVSGRVTHGTKPYVRPDLVVVANDFSDLVDGSLHAPINVDENGAVVATSEVWTASNAAGNFAGLSCSNWTSGAGTMTGRQGRASALDSMWTNTLSESDCDENARIYCLEN